MTRRLDTVSSVQIHDFDCIDPKTSNPFSGPVPCNLLLYGRKSPVTTFPALILIENLECGGWADLWEVCGVFLPAGQLQPRQTDIQVQRLMRGGYQCCGSRMIYSRSSIFLEFWIQIRIQILPMLFKHIWKKIKPNNKSKRRIYQVLVPRYQYLPFYISNYSPTVYSPESTGLKLEIKF